VNQLFPDLVLLLLTKILIWPDFTPNASTLPAGFDEVSPVFMWFLSL
jgi:hypothetical protein